MPFCFHSICGIWLLLFQQNIHMALSVNQQRFGVILWTGICNIDSKRGLVLLFMNFHQQAWMPSEYALEPPICVICVADSLYAMRHLYFQFSWFDLTLLCKRVHLYFFWLHHGCSWWNDAESRQKCIVLQSLQVYWSLLLRSSLVVTANPWWETMGLICWEQWLLCWLHSLRSSCCVMAWWRLQTVWHFCEQLS